MTAGSSMAGETNDPAGIEWAFVVIDATSNVFRTGALAHRRPRVSDGWSERRYNK